MNQILSVDNNKGRGRKKSKEARQREPRGDGQIQIDSIVKFFAIVLLIFGICMIGTGSYSMYKDYQDGTSSSKPTISVENESEEEVTLKVSHRKNLSKVTYNWSNGDIKEIQANGKKSVEEKIEIPTGTNTLIVIATDVDGQESRYERQYTRQGDINIAIEKVDPKVKITATGNEELSYMTYRWDEEEETRVDINDTKIEQEVDVSSGEHTLTVIVVNVNNKSETKTMKVIGNKKPNLEVTTDGSSKFIINTSDEIGIKKVEFVINGKDKYVIQLDAVRSLEDRKEFTYEYPLNSGRNTIEVTVYNENDVTASFGAVVNMPE